MLRLGFKKTVFVGSARDNIGDVETIANTFNANGGGNDQNNAGANNYNL
jgi:hypothetical protein